MIPTINRTEWEKLLRGEEKVKSFALQMKLNSLRLNLKLDKISLQQGIKDLHDYCSTNEKMFENDLKDIFK